MSLLDHDYMRKPPRWGAGEYGEIRYDNVRKQQHADLLNREFERGRQDMLLELQRQQTARWQRMERLRRALRLLLLLVVVLLGLAIWWSVRFDHLAVRATNGRVALTLCYVRRCAPAPSVAPAPTSVRQPSAAPSVAARPEAGVHVCAPQRYSPSLHACTGDIPRFALRHLGIIHLSARALTGGHFMAAQFVVSVARGGHHGRFKQLANLAISVGRGHGAWAITLQKLFRSAHVKPRAGRTYRIKIHAGNRLLGSTTFTVVR